MNKTKPFLWFMALMLTGLLAACGSEGTSSDPVVTTVGTAGIAVDPYIVNAHFEEISADGTQIIQNSTESDNRGRFVFANPVQENSIIRLKSSSRGMHGNAPYTGMLKRQVRAGETGSVVISPLTTLLANGMSESEVIALLESAGVAGISAADLTDDPMQGLTGATGGISDVELRGLHANMAVNTLMLALNNFDYAGEMQNAVNLADCVALSADSLNASGFQAMANTISPELGGSFTFDDLAAAAVEVQRTVVSQIRQELLAGSSSISSARFAELRSAANGEMQTIARQNCADRLGVSNTGSNGKTLFSDNCAGCHNLGSESGTMNLSGDGSLLNDKFGGGASHKGRTLNVSDLLALSNYLNASTPVEPPPVPLTGSELYATECQGCHGSLATTNISDRSSNGITGAIAADTGGMSYLALSADQIRLIVDALPIVTEPPAPTTDRTGVEVYDQECAVCHILGSHDPAGNIDLAARGSVIVTKIESGHKGKTLSAVELSALADYANTFGSAPPPVVPRSATTIYNNICTGCHLLSGYDEAGSIDLAGKGSIAVTKVAAGHGGSVSTEELTGLASWLDNFNTPPPPVIPRNGETLYNQSCGACHKLYGYDTVGNLDLAGMGSTALTKLGNGHGGTVSIEERQNIANWLDSFAPAPPPVVDRNGETVYSENCAGCHKLYGYDASGNVDLAGQGSLALTKLGTGHGGSTTDGEQINLANWLDTFSPAPPPVTSRSGVDIYDNDCAGCHKVNGYDANGTAPDIAGVGSTVVTKINGGHNGIALIAAELGNLSAWIDTFQPGDPYAGSCNACHGQPPLTGAHEVHTSLAKVGTDCTVCHTGAEHNGAVDLDFPTTWNAKNGNASSNGSSCASISCHGGQTTPDWNSGSLNSSTQCKSCHSSGTGQYNGYSSGRHNKHERYDCLVCHDAAKLANGHFDDLSTFSFEQAPATTIKSSISYSGGTCSTASCHGRESW